MLDYCQLDQQEQVCVKLTKNTSIFIQGIVFETRTTPREQTSAAPNLKNAKQSSKAWNRLLKRKRLIKR